MGRACIGRVFGKSAKGSNITRRASLAVNPSPEQLAAGHGRHSGWSREVRADTMSVQRSAQKGVFLKEHEGKVIHADTSADSGSTRDFT